MLWLLAYPTGLQLWDNLARRREQKNKQQRQFMGGVTERQTRDTGRYFRYKTKERGKRTLDTTATA